MSNLLVSTIIPVYNGERYVAEAIASVLAQSYATVEVLVVDDGSQDHTRQVVQAITDPRVRYLHQSNQGAALARNLGIATAQGDFFAFLDADDLWAGEKLAWQMAELAARPELEMVFGHYTEFRSPELGQATVTPPRTLPGYSSGTLLIRRAAFFQAGLFSGAWRLGEFMEWYSRTMDAGLRQAMMDKVVLYRRVHQHNMGITRRDERAEYARVLHAIVERRRTTR
jgi:glycosyltransferase involved in cell wall biosynthesis